MRSLIILICMLITSGMAFSQTKAENAAADKVAALPEVRSFMHTAKESQPQIMMDSVPGKTLKYYWVRVGLGNMEQFRVSMDFYVHAKTGQILYLDLFTDNKSGEQLLTLPQWRKWRKLPQWQKMHCYTGSGKDLKFKPCAL